MQPHTRIDRISKFKLRADTTLLDRGVDLESRAIGFAASDKVAWVQVIPDDHVPGRQQVVAAEIERCLP